MSTALIELQTCVWTKQELYCQRLSVHLTVFDWTHGGLSVSSLHTGMC